MSKFYTVTLPLPLRGKSSICILLAYHLELMRGLLGDSPKISGLSEQSIPIPCYILGRYLDILYILYNHILDIYMKVFYIN